VKTPVYTDPALASHQIVGARSPMLPDPRVLLRGAEAFARGHRQKGVLGPAAQLGGVFVITPEGKLAFRYVSKYAGDHPKPADVVAALERSVASAGS
jgi:hypothetical protein